MAGEIPATPNHIEVAMYVVYFVAYDTHYLIGVYNDRALAQAAAKAKNESKDKEYGGYASIIETKMNETRTK